jgi:hypothetical protein
LHPELRLDNREIIAAHLASPEELHGIALTGALAAYLGVSWPFSFRDISTDSGVGKAAGRSPPSLAELFELEPVATRPVAVNIA